MVGNRKYIWLAIFAAVIAAGCKHGSEDEKVPDETDRLFRETIRLAEQYADSIRLSSDSASSVAIFHRFNTKLDSLNNTVPPDTDLLFTKDENDRMYAKLMEVRRLYEQKMIPFGGIPVDTVTLPEDVEPSLGEPVYRPPLSTVQEDYREENDITDITEEVKPEEHVPVQETEPENSSNTDD